MRKTTKFLLSFAIVVLAAGALLAHRHRFEKDDEDLEEAIEAADRAQAQEFGVAGRCGVERWGVKTLSDRDAGSVNTSPITASIGGPGGLSTTPPATPWLAFDATTSAHQMPPDVRTMSGPYAETQAFRIKGSLLRYKLESDSDYHIVVADPKTGETMIVESVDPVCAPSSSFKQTFQTVRDQFLSSFSAPQPAVGFIEIGGTPVTVVGVRFFDHLHGQNGVAKNGAELHAILCFSTGADCDQ
ncbi:MAG: hypothetical protein HY077_06515 [Elusimicrobia bacterium]|nr:hypothetical protein [Elusimicrobiota bacterium]